MSDIPEFDILKIAELLKTETTIEDLKEEFNTTYPAPYSSVKINNDSQTLDEYEFLQNESNYLDNRKQPAYDIIYRQTVTPEDIFLQLGPKTPSSACCEDMIINIILKNEKFSTIDLNLTENSVTIDSYLYKLNLKLPHRIDPDKSVAKWDQNTEILTLTLKLNREFDYINF